MHHTIVRPSPSARVLVTCQYTAKYAALVARPVRAGRCRLSAKRFDARYQALRDRNAFVTATAGHHIRTHVALGAAHGAALTQHGLKDAIRVWDNVLACALGSPAAALVHAGTVAGVAVGDVVHSVAGSAGSESGKRAAAPPCNAGKPQAIRRGAAIGGGAAVGPAMVLTGSQLLLGALPKLGLAGVGGLVGGVAGLFRGTASATKSGFVALRTRRRTARHMRSIVGHCGVPGEAQVPTK